MKRCSVERRRMRAVVRALVGACLSDCLALLLWKRIGATSIMRTKGIGNYEIYSMRDHMELGPSSLQFFFV